MTSGEFIDIMLSLIKIKIEVDSSSSSITDKRKKLYSKLTSSFKPIQAENVQKCLRILYRTNWGVKRERFDKYVNTNKLVDNQGVTCDLADELINVTAKESAKCMALLNKLRQLMNYKDPIYTEYMMDTIFGKVFPGISLPDIFATVWNASTSTVKWPVMLANRYTEGSIDFSEEDWYYSRKYDGVRVNIVCDGDSVIAYSRTGKTLTSVPHIIKDLPVLEDGYVLDGELVAESALTADNFRDTVSTVMSKKVTSKSADLRLLAFDMIPYSDMMSGKCDEAFSSRYTKLVSFLKSVNSSNIIIVSQTKVESTDMLHDAFEDAMSKGWEGLMIRKDAAWEATRSNNLLKIKSFKDEEFTITDVTVGDYMTCNGTVYPNYMLSAQITLLNGCKVEVGTGWSLRDRKVYAANPDILIGRLMKVKFFDYTYDSQGNIQSLRFPSVKFVYPSGVRED